MIFEFIESKSVSYLELFACTSIAWKLDFGSGGIICDFACIELDSTVQKVNLTNFYIGSVLGGAVEDETECCCKSTIKLDFRLVFFSGSPV